MCASEPQLVESGAAHERSIVVADLHLSTGAGAELFRADRQFARFTEHIAAREQPVDRMVLAGDAFDLLHTTNNGRAWRDTSEETSLVKLELAAGAHPLVLRALADLATTGVQLEILPGNHDLELVRPSAQRLLREILESHRSGAGRGVRFHPWIYYQPGLAYVEHGSQHHGLNAVASLLEPSPDRLEVPLGAELDFYRLDRDAGARIEATGRLGAALVRRLFRFRDQRTDRSYREKVVSPLAQPLGIGRQTLVELDSLTPLRPLEAELGLARAGLTSLFDEARGTPMRAVDYLHQAAARIDNLLTREEAGVHFYIFGHSHVAVDRPVRADCTNPRYLNPGTWSRIVPTSMRQVAGTIVRFGFIELQSPNGGYPTARLLRWNDADQAPECV